METPFQQKPLPQNGKAIRKYTIFDLKKQAIDVLSRALS